MMVKEPADLVHSIMSDVNDRVVVPDPRTNDHFSVWIQQMIDLTVLFIFRINEVVDISIAYDLHYCRTEDN